MKDANEEEFLLRRYLLGELAEGEQESVEERFITDRDFKERVLVIEDELVEDYLSSELSEAEEALFVRHFLSTPEQRRRLRIADTLKKHLAAKPPAHFTEPGGEPRTPGVKESEVRPRPFWRNPSVLVPALLSLLFAIVLGLVWLAQTQQRREELVDLRRELERLNQQPQPDGSRWVFLTPLNVRGDREANVLQSPVSGTVVQLWLMLVKDEYQSYQVIFLKDGDANQFPVSGLRAETTSSGRAIPLRIPAERLPPGTYLLKLNGITEGERIEEVGEYNFRVSR